MHLECSVIMSTYNATAWLEKVIWGFAAQTAKAFEIIIADDGSKAETKECIDALRAETGLRIKHVWQEDEGFQKTRLLNKALKEVASPYVVFTDGDCIPRHDFLGVHWFVWHLFPYKIYEWRFVQHLFAYNGKNAQF